MARLHDIIQDHSRVFLAGSAGEPLSVSTDILSRPNLSLVTSFVPGINRLSAAMIGPGTTVSGPFMAPSLQAAQRAGSYRHLPVSYSGMVKYLGSLDPFDLCFVHVAPPDRHGRCSLGPSAEFMPSVLRNSARVVAIVNEALPSGSDSPTVMLRDCAEAIECSAPLIAYDPGPIGVDARQIARNVATFVADGATIQCGLGKVPMALMTVLHDRRKLRLHSGMVSDWIIELEAAGALDPAANHTTTVLLGTQRVYEWLGAGARISIRGAEQVHAPATLAAIEGLVAINSALQVDLLGQCNLEHAGGRAVSGVGGAADFARGARLSPKGMSIIALPATLGTGEGLKSRIVARLDPGAIVSLARTEVDIVVTEHGCADLRGRSVHERAEAIIEIAAPTFRGELKEAWRVIAQIL